MKKKGNWDEKRPGTGERLSSRFSVHASGADTLGGLPELTTADFAAALGLVRDNLQRIVLGAKFGEFEQDRAQLKEIVIRRSWIAWGEREDAGNLNAQLNSKIAELVLADWYLEIDHRKAVGDTSRAKTLRVDYRRFKAHFKHHHKELVSWLDAIEVEGLRQIRSKLRK